MKTRAMIAASVAQSDSFLSMSIEAQWLYMMLLFEADVVGRILAIRRITRGFGVDESCLDELLAAGFLMQADGEWYDRHTWKNNKFAAKIATRAQDDEAIASGTLTFEGEPYKSSYAKVTPSCNTETPKRILSASGSDVMQRIPPASASVPTSASASAELTALPSSPSLTGADSAGEEMRPCMCKKCGDTNARWYVVNGVTRIVCDACGEYDYRP